MAGTRIISPTQMRKYFATQAQRRQHLLDQAEVLMGQAGKIEQDVFAPMSLKPDAFLKVRKVKAVKGTGPRAKKGAQQADVLALLQNKGGTISTQDAIQLFESKGYRTSANAVLMRMAKAKLITNASRGSWEIRATGKVAAKATK